MSADPGSPPRPYHHGDLPAALRAATAELVGERGPSGFSLREVARRAGVSHGAPAHHFGDAQGLLASVAMEGFELLADALAETAGVADAVERLRLVGQAYVRTARANPGHFELIGLPNLLLGRGERCTTGSGRAYRQLLDTIEAVREQCNHDLDVETAAVLCWAAMQGLLVVAPILEHVATQAGSPPVGIETIVDRMAELLVAGLATRR